MGGSGGIGGLGGNGGRGGNGAQVVIHTNDPSVLMLIDIDVSGGKGGSSGPHGKSGEGGDGGEGGEGGNPGSWMADVVKVGEKGMAITSKEKVLERPGRRGKRGKRGKTGKVQKAKPTKPGKDGEAGKVSFCIYGASGLKESAGTPYHLMLPKRLSRSLLPISFLNSNHTTDTSNTSLFLYGGILRYGPLSPVNIGGLTCPPSEMEGLLSVTVAGKTEIVTSSQVTFPSIPKSHFTSYGELKPEEAKFISITLPNLNSNCYQRSSPTFDCNLWPWPATSFQLPPNKALFKIQLTVEDVPFTGTYEDGEMVATKEFPILIDYPIKFSPLSSVGGTSGAGTSGGVTSGGGTSGGVTSGGGTSGGVTSGGGTSFQGPAFICVGDTQVISFSITNKLSNTKLDKEALTSYKCLLRVTGYQFRPNLTSSFITSAQEIASMGTGTCTPSEFLTNSYEMPLHLHLIESGGQLTLSANLTLPTKESNSVNDSKNLTQIGSKICIRPELYHESILLEALPPTTIRVVPDPLSVTVTDEVTSRDLLIFVSTLLTVEDYLLIRKYVATIGFRVHFLDCQYWSTPPLATANGTINPLVWEKFKGKGTILWFPTQENLNCIANADLQTHLECGGSLLCSMNSSFRWNKATATPPEKPTRRCVMVPVESFQLHNLAKTDAIVEVTGSKKKIQGTILPFLTMCLLSSLSPQDKLHFFLRNRKECEVILGESIIENQNIIPPSSCSCLPCFSSTPKIVPIDSTPLTLQDCLFASLRTDIEIDLQFYPKHGNNNLCYAIQEIILFLTSPSATSSAEYQGYLHAILLSSQVNNELLNHGGVHKKNWKMMKTEIKKILKSSLVASRASTVNFISYAQRLNGIDIISNGKTSTIARSYRFNEKVAYAFAVSNGNGNAGKK
jgi:hypothetical protein